MDRIDLRHGQRRTCHGSGTHSPYQHDNIKIIKRLLSVDLDRKIGGPLQGPSLGIEFSDEPIRNGDAIVEIIGEL
ncbi:MAG: hypothetical protein ACYS80_20345 [Planctomycetota bacterium]|jgi:hypothetical protein